MDETVLHVIWECSWVIKVWRQTFLRDVCKVWREKDMFGLFLHVLTVAREKEVEWFGVIAWHLWQERNRKVHGGQALAVKGFISKIVAWWEAFEKVCCKEEEHSNQGRKTQHHNVDGMRGREVAWRRPEQGIVKLNIDGALDHQNGVVGTGAICRNENGDCLCVLATPGTNFLSPLSCEFLALVNRLHFCIQVGFARVEVESDLQEVIAALDSSQEDLSVDGALVKEAKLLMGCFESCRWTYAPREANKAAHTVARKALELEFPTYWW
ncbi:hypothetical protein ACLB2K_045746 [Fragaria x ananassa]